MSKIGYGGYQLGANSANILVQDRITGMINEERMSVYVSIFHHNLRQIGHKADHNRLTGPAGNPTAIQRPQEPRHGEEEK